MHVLVIAGSQANLLFFCQIPTNFQTLTRTVPPQRRRTHTIVKHQLGRATATLQHCCHLISCNFLVGEGHVLSVGTFKLQCDGMQVAFNIHTVAFTDDWMIEDRNWSRVDHSFSRRLVVSFFRPGNLLEKVIISIFQRSPQGRLSSSIDFYVFYRYLSYEKIFLRTMLGLFLAFNISFSRTLGALQCLVLLKCGNSSTNQLIYSLLAVSILQSLNNLGCRSGLSEGLVCELILGLSISN